MKHLLAALVCSLFAAGAAAQEAYPSRPIRLVVGWGPGGATDVLARLLGQQLSKQLGQAVLVENKPGAGSMIANAQVARAKPDGYMLLVADTSFTMLPATRRTLPYDPLKDFTAISRVAAMPMVAVVSPTLGIRSLSELVALAARSERIAFSSGGEGTVLHLTADLIGKSTGMRTQHIPYKGGAEAINAVVGGQVQFAVAAVSTALPFIKTGKLTALAVINDRARIPTLPAVPTMAELGFKNLAIAQWYAILGPADMDRRIIRRLESEVRNALASPEVQTPLASQAFAVGASSPEDLATHMATDLNHWMAAAAGANLVAE